jgi:hypothetical protein
MIEGRGAVGRVGQYQYAPKKDVAFWGGNALLEVREDGES